MTAPDSLAWAGAEVMLAATVVAGAALVAERLIPRGAAGRSALWTAAVAALALCPAAVAGGRLLPWHAALVAAPPSPALFDINAASEPAPLPPASPPAEFAPVPPSAPPALGSPPAAEVAEVPPRPPAAPVDWWRVAPTALLTAWIAGTLALLLRLAVGEARVAGLVRRSRPLDGAPGVAESARALGAPSLPPRASGEVRGPVVAGLVRPRVLLPAGLAERLGARQLRAVLAHEYAHILRRDPLTRLVQRLVGAVLWPHPLVHAVNRRLDAAREEVCDNHALAAVGAPDYAETLLVIAKLCRPDPTPVGGLPMLARRSTLERRVIDLLDPRRDPVVCPGRARRAAVIVLVGAALLAAASVGLRPASARPDDPAKPAAPVDRAAAGSVAGQVSGADGKPVAGADVRLLENPDAGYTLPAPTRRAATDAGGRFAFDGVPAGKHSVAAFAGGSSSRAESYRWKRVTVPAEGPAGPVELRLKPDLTLPVRVVAASDGRPLAGARVRLAYSDHDRDHLTDASGNVRVPLLTSEVWNVQAAAPGHAAAEQVVDLKTTSPGPVEFRLAPGGRVAGVVTGPDGNPLAGVGVSARRADGSGAQLEYVTTGADGAYFIDFLPVGRATLSFSKLDFTRLGGEVTIFPGGTATLDVALKPRPHGGSVRGAVTDSAGKPVAGAELLNMGMVSDLVRKTTTGADGAFLLGDVYDRHGHEFTVRAKGFAPKVVQFTPGTAEKPAEVAVKLDAGHAIKARVVDPAGRPVAGAWVYAAEGRYEMTGPAESAKTGADGRFAFESLPPDCPFDIRADGYSVVHDRKLPLDGAAEVTVTLEPQGALVGRVVDAASGKPVPRFTVSLTFSYDRRPGDKMAGYATSLSEPGTTFAGPDGRFAVPELLTGMPFQLSVTAEGYRRKVLPRVIAKPSAELGAGEEVALTPQDPAKLLTVKGRLLDAAGNAAVGAELRLIAATDRPAGRDHDHFPFNWEMVESGGVAQNPTVLQFQRGVSGPGGAFEFKGVPDGAEVELVYWGAGLPGTRVDRLERLTAAERAALEVHAVATATVVGTIDAKAFPETSEVITGNGSTSRSLTAIIGPGADGRPTFRFDAMPVGEHWLSVYGRVESLGGGRSTVSVVARRKVTVVAGRELRVDLAEADRKKPR